MQIPLRSICTGYLQRYSRHDVAFLYVITVAFCCLITWRIPASILGRRATVALMTGCEALLTMYRTGKKPRGGLPSGNSARLRARMGQYGESRQRSLRAVRQNQPTGIIRLMTCFSVFTRGKRLQVTNVPARDLKLPRRPRSA
jgi:hypothetical protein